MEPSARGNRGPVEGDLLPSSNVPGLDADLMVVRDVTELPDFRAAAKVVVDHLREVVGLSVWMVAQAVGDDWVILETSGDGDPAAGSAYRWADTFCVRMIAGEGPRVAPDIDRVPVYAEAALTRLLAIRAYAGVPLETPEGGLYGTLCAIDPSPQPERLIAAQPLIELFGRLLSTILADELALAESRRRADRAEEDALADALTGLHNRRAWEAFLEVEEDRCRRYGRGASVVILDLDELKRVNDDDGHAAGDRLILSAARTLGEVARSSDVAARLGGDEFGIVLVEAGPDEAVAAVQRLRDALARVGVSASIGVAHRRSDGGMIRAWRDADEAMYEEKRRRQRRRSAPPEG